MITLHALSPANEFLPACTYATQEAADAATDRLIERGFEVFTDRLACQLAHDRFRRQFFTAPAERIAARQYAGKAVF